MVFQPYSKLRTCRTIFVYLSLIWNYSIMIKTTCVPKPLAGITSTQSNYEKELFWSEKI